MRFYKTPALIKASFPQCTWTIKHNTSKSVYLTFDDGPIPEVTDFVLDTLDTYKAKATFFCVGENIKFNNRICTDIFTKGHRLANHTYNHLDGWRTDFKTYVDNIAKCQRLLEQVEKKRLFRPPYGKITFKQAHYLRALGYQIILWDVLSYDFDRRLSPETSLKNLIKYTKNGSIVVFHDNIKSYQTLQYVLPRFLNYLQEHHFSCKAI